MQTFKEFLNEEEQSGVAKKVRSAIGKGKTDLERGSHWLHAPEGASKSDLASNVDKKLGTKHTIDQHGRAVWNTGSHTVHMHQHSDGHHMFQVQKA